MTAQSSEANQFEPELPVAARLRPFDIGGLFLAMTGLLLLTLAITFFAGQKALQADRAILRVHGTIDALNDVMSSFKDAETGQRGYLLTGDPDYLTPYEKAVAILPQRLSDLDARAAD